MTNLTSADGRGGERQAQQRMRCDRARLTCHGGHWRHHPRVLSHGVRAAIAQAPDTPFAVLNISEAGMLLERLELAPGATIDFELEGDGVHGTGSGRVVHCTDGTAGIAVRRWHGTLGLALRDVIERGLLAASSWRELYLDPRAPSQRPAAIR